MFRKATIRSALLLLGLIPAASAVESSFWKQSGNWRIRVDTTLGYGCFMVTSYDGGVVLRVGIDQDRRKDYFIVDNHNWESLEVGKRYPLTMQFDRHGPWNAPSYGFSFGSDLAYLHAIFGSSKVFEEFMRSHNLIIRYEGREIARLSLRGTFAATVAMAECQSAMDELRDTRLAPRSDPFASPAARQNLDPFAG